jgi:hypothetical protein
VLHNLAVPPSAERTLAPENLRETKRPAVTSFCNQMVQRSLFMEFGGFDGRTRVAGDTDLTLRLLRFHGIGNMAKVLYSRRLHDRSLTQHPATGFDSPLRQQYRRRAYLRQEKIKHALEAEDIDTVRELCTEDLYDGDIRIDGIHTGFDVGIA